MLRDNMLNALLEGEGMLSRKRDGSGRKSKVGDDALFVAVAATREQIAKAFEGSGKVSTRLRAH